MSSPNALITAQRKILPIEHQQLRQHMPAINRLGDLGIKWRRLGETGVTVIERGIYQRAAKKAAGQLALFKTTEILEEINSALIPTIGSASDRLSTEVTTVDYFGEDRFVSIGYVVENGALEREQSQLTIWLDQKNGVNSDWGDFDPHVSIATIDANNATDAILDAFWNIHPASITLLPLTVKAV